VNHGESLQASFFFNSLLEHPALKWKHWRRKDALESKCWSVLCAFGRTHGAL